MKALSSSETRQLFLDFFKEKGHHVEPSASLIPVEDPTLLWINSGVATLKKYFDGTAVPESPRLTNAQKSIRTNDIENVGKTARHHTMFEMLGNFSIGDYFKEEAITWAWEFLTDEKWLALDPDKLYVTVHPEDSEARRLWQEKIGLSEDRVIDIADNFWEIGVGPSGPNSEIFYDRGESYNDVAEDDPENYPGGENERYLEIWNLVFSEFNHTEEDTYEPLPHKNIDTGMGLERLVSVLQDTPTNFETDLFMPIIKATEALAVDKIYGEDEQVNVSFKVIADHTRAVAFAIGDGALPSNEGRGYVLRRLLRRAVMHGKKLGIHKPFMHQLVPVVGSIMSAHYPEVLEQKEFISKVIKTEEERFHETINDGLSILEEVIRDLKEKTVNELSGEVIFKLYDTYGFPVELTEEIAEDAGLSVDHAGFEKEMEQQRERARQARQEVGSMSLQSETLLAIKEASTFTGYDCLENEATLVALVANDERISEAVVSDVEEVEAIFNQTPFYAEMGGQIFDTGWIYDNEGRLVGTVDDVQKSPNGQPLHHIRLETSLMEGQTYRLVVDHARRRAVIKNHTATHLLHQALKDVLGEHANQAGSLVTPDYLRFDFTHFGQVTKEELEKMESIVNQKIWQQLPVMTVETDIETAKEMGAMALFGEKYGQNVRVVNVSDYSLELCGGVHVGNTSEIGVFKLISESGIGAGVRRIEAVTGEKAYQYLVERENTLKATAELVKSKRILEVPQKVIALQEQLKQAQKENEQLLAKMANQEAGAIFNDVASESGITYVAKEVAVKDMNQLRQLADQWKQKAVSDILVLGLVNEGKANLLVAMSDDMVKKGYKAGDLIKAIAPMINGGGGGRPDMAQAGGKKPEGMSEAIAAVPTWISEVTSV